MQGGRRNGDRLFDFGDPFPSFGGLDGFGFPGFERHRSLASSFFGGRDPFDDPFFTRPFGTMFDPFGMSANMPSRMHPSTDYIGNSSEPPKRVRGPVIEELDTDEEGEEKNDKDGNSKKHRTWNKEPLVEMPDDEPDSANKASKAVHMPSRTSSKKFNQTETYNNAVHMPSTRPHMVSFQSSTVSYGGPNGTYYTSSSTRRTGSDGITLEENREADTTTRQATHRISRGINNQGHSVTRKLNSDGMVNTVETMHNLKEDDLSGFEASWNRKANHQFPGWSGDFNHQQSLGNSGRLSLPSSQQASRSRGKERVLQNELRWKTRD